ncbi:MAG TPA: hypothetical protein VF144_17205 [Chitinophagaceae bacterium]
MKHFFKLTCVAAVLTACVLSLPFIKSVTDLDGKLTGKAQATNQLTIALNAPVKAP